VPVLKRSLDIATGLAIVLFVAFVFGWLAFDFTSSMPPEQAHSNPVCVGIVQHDAGFDPWTGVPHGRFYTCPPAPGATPTVYFQVALPEDVAGHRAIPVPVGFAIGLLFAGGIWFLLAVARDRRPTRASDIAKR
jgi:hypothetical protein